MCFHVSAVEYKMILEYQKDKAIQYSTTQHNTNHEIMIFGENAIAGFRPVLVKCCAAKLHVSIMFKSPKKNASQPDTKNN